MWLLLVAASASECPPWPGEHVTIARDLAPLGDVDGDGLADLVVHMSVLERWTASGEGLVPVAPVPIDLEDRTDLQLPTHPGDADGDGRDDVAAVVTATPEGSPVARLHWSSGGRGPDRDQLLAAPPSGAWSVEWLPDLDGDGDDELALGAWWAGEVAIHAGTPDGPAPEPWLVLRAPAPWIGFGRALWSSPDLTGDGRPDLFVGAANDDGPGTMFLYASTPDGLAPDPVWQTPLPLGIAARRGRLPVAVGDLDGDGLNDLLSLGRPGAEGWGIWHGRPDGIDAEDDETLAIDDTGAPLIAELDGDAEVEVVMGLPWRRSGALAAWLDGVEGAVVGVSGWEWLGRLGQDMVAIDTDGDGVATLLAGQRGELRAYPPAAIQPRPQEGVHTELGPLIPTWVTLVDIDGGGIDAIVSDIRTRQSWIYLDAALTLTGFAGTLNPIGPPWRQVDDTIIAVADLDGDGMGELIRRDGPRLLADNLVTGTTWGWVTGGVSASATLAGDLDADGRDDLIAWQSDEDGDRTWFLLYGADDGWRRGPDGWLPPGETTIAPWLQPAGDVTLDGHDDVISASRDGDLLIVELLAGSAEGLAPVWTLRTPGTHVRPADLDGDGLTDLVLSTVEGPVSWVAGVCGGFGSEVVSFDVVYGGGPVIGDVDADGDADLITRADPFDGFDVRLGGAGGPSEPVRLACADPAMVFTGVVDHTFMVVFHDTVQHWASPPPRRPPAPLATCEVPRACGCGAVARGGAAWWVVAAALVRRRSRRAASSRW